MTHGRRAWIAAAPWLLVAGAALATPTLRLLPSPVSTVIYPEQEIRVRFDHAGHLVGRDLACPDCHDLARTSRSPADNLIPREAVCARCHAADTRDEGRGPADAEARCESCHPDQTERVERTLIPSAFLRFGHADHDEEGCERCHTRIAVRGLATADDLPGMRLCLGCHDGRRADRRCVTCHISDPDGRLRTTLGRERLQPPGWMRGAEHSPTWVTDHERTAVAERRLCQSCHREHDCLACHDGNVRPRDVHPGDWISAHPLEARAGELSCRGCHRGQSFCRTCHLRAGVALGSPPGRRDTTAPVVHEDPDWADPVAPRHAIQARRALQTCVSCHAGRDCVSCHAVVSPHPPGFADDRCESLVRAGSRACTACHDSVEGLCE
jgi:hypothetical protein